MDSISITIMCAYYIEVFLHVIDTTLKCVSNGKYEVFNMSLSLICVVDIGSNVNMLYSSLL